jgi:hypothetical protein
MREAQQKATIGSEVMAFNFGHVHDLVGSTKEVQCGNCLDDIIAVGGNRGV